MLRSLGLLLTFLVAGSTAGPGPGIAAAADAGVEDAQAAIVGDPYAAVYYLPAPSGTPLLVLQGNDTGRLGGDHTGTSRFAYDLGIASGASFPVVASRAGIVEAVRSDAPEGTCPDAGEAVPPDCWREVNYVVVDHLDGTSALYLHLAADSSADLAVGQVVQRGHYLGRSGASGWTSGPVLTLMLMGSEPAAADDPAWWRPSIGPIAFADESVREAYPDGIPGGGIVPDGPFVSGNPGSLEGPEIRRPVPRPGGLPARLPWPAGTSHTISRTGRSSPDGYGFEVVAGSRGDAISDATQAFPLFGGRLRYAGCASGRSRPLGRIVVIERAEAGRTYQAVFSHLSSIDAGLVPAEAGASAQAGEPAATDSVPDVAATVSANQPVGTFGSSFTTADGTCDDEDGRPTRLHVALLEDALVTPSGEIIAGRPVEPWPLLGEGAYVPQRWWRGPMVARDISEADAPAAEAAPSGRWFRGTTTDASNVPYAESVDLVVRAQGGAELREVRLLAQHRDWAQRRKGKFRGLDDTQVWRLLAVCRPPGDGGVPGTTKGCRWEGDARSATVAYKWDPTATEQRGRAPWLPPARAAIGTADRSCVPVTLSFEVYDTAGRYYIPATGKVARRCAARAAGLGRSVYLRPLQPPAAPRAVRLQCLAEGTFGCFEFLLRWQHAQPGETGFRIYAERANVADDACKISKRSGPWLVTTLPAGRNSWRVSYPTIDKAIDDPLGPDLIPLDVTLSVAAVNAAGESPRATSKLAEVPFVVDVIPC